MPQGRHRTLKAGRVKGEKKARALTHEQAQKLLAECEANPDLKLVVLLGLLAGLRRGEIFALDFADIDWDRDLIHVRHNLSWRHGRHIKKNDGGTKFELTTPKTDNSVRTVDLSPKLKDALWERYMESKMAGRTGLIFQSRAVGGIRQLDAKTWAVTIRNQGVKTFHTKDEAEVYFHQPRTPFDPHNVAARWFQAAVDRVLEKADKEMDEETYTAFKGLTLHHLRHTFGSWKVAQGEDILYVSAQMGHARPSITFDVYSHLIDKRRPAAAALTDEKLFGKARRKD
jgi:integrase